jgi:phosphoglucomutase
MYVQYMETLFDFEMLRAFVQQDAFSLCFDGMHGISGPYATEVLVKKLGLKQD